MSKSPAKILWNQADRSVYFPHEDDSVSVSRRDHLVDTALNLFCRHGFRATGIDFILGESGVAKKTLYTHFSSKEELIVAALHKRDEEFMAKLRTSIARLAPRQAGDPRLSRVLAFFDGLDEWFASDSFNGCAFINASGEFPRPDSPIHRACAAHKQRVLNTLEDLLGSVAADGRETLAREIALLADGAIVSAHTTGDRGAARIAKGAARRLLESHLAPRT